MSYDNDQGAALLRPAAQSAPQSTQATGSRPVRTVAAAAVAARRPFAVPPRPAVAVTPPQPVPVAMPPVASEPLARQEPSAPGPDTAIDPVRDLPVLRIVCWQLALLLAFLAIGGPWPQAVALVTTAIALVAVTAIRMRGVWLSTLLARRARLLLRPTTRELSDVPGTGVGGSGRNNGVPDTGVPDTCSSNTGRALLGMLAPGAGVVADDIAGRPAGVLSRTEELLVVLTPRGAAADGLIQTALSGTLLPGPEPGLPGLGTELVLHRGPQQSGTPRVWLAVRALRDIDVADDADLRTALTNTVRRVLRKLHRDGLDADVLTERDLLATLAALAHTGPGRSGIQEDWRFWRAGPVAQSGMRLSGLDTVAAGNRSWVLGRLLAACAGTAVTVSISTAKSNSTAEAHSCAVLRIASTNTTAVNAVTEQLARLGEGLGVHLERLDGLHGPAVAATLPIGGNRP
jgi:hypothetical protein